MRPSLLTRWIFALNGLTSREYFEETIVKTGWIYPFRKLAERYKRAARR